MNISTFVESKGLCFYVMIVGNYWATAFPYTCFITYAKVA